MKTISILLMLVIIPVALLHCSDDSLLTQSDPGRLKVVGMNDQFSIRYGETVLVESENMTVKFEEVIGDSRCPSGVQCCWEGQAEIRLIFRKSGYEPVDAVVKIRPGRDPEKFPDLTGEAFGFKIYLNNLEPYPDIERPRVIEDYEALITIE